MDSNLRPRPIQLEGMEQGRDPEVHLVRLDISIANLATFFLKAWVAWLIATFIISAALFLPILFIAYLYNYKH
jgi:hypothetical protein